MKLTMRSAGFQTLTLALVLSGAGNYVAQAQQEGPVPTSATFSVESKAAAELDPAKVKVAVNGRDTEVTSLARVAPKSIQLAILIDDGLRSSFGLQIRDMQSFIRELPPGVQVFVGYMQNGRVVGTERGFSTDHAEVAQQIRVPQSVAGISASPYFCLSDFVKRWPSEQRGTRVVLMLTNGVDPYNGSISPLNQDSPYVRASQEDAIRAGAAVYAIPYHERGLPGGVGSFSGQSYLQQVADATGGRLLYQGSFNPVTIKPYLSKMLADLRESYTAVFPVDATHEKDGTLKQLKITTSQPGIKLHAPDAVHPGEPVSHD